MKSILLALFLFLLAEYSFAEELINYTITSDSQINTLEGDLEAKGNVVIKSNSGNFEAYSDKLSIDKDDKSLKLIGNVYVKNLPSLSKESLSELASKLPLLLLITTFPTASNSPSKVFV